MFLGYLIIQSLLVLCRALATPSFPCPTNSINVDSHSSNGWTPLNAVYFFIPRHASTCEEVCYRDLIELSEKGYSFVATSFKEFDSLQLSMASGFIRYSCDTSAGTINRYEAIKDNDLSVYTDSHCICVRREHVVWTRNYHASIYNEFVRPLQYRLETLSSELDQTLSNLDKLDAKNQQLQNESMHLKQKHDARMEKEKETQRQKEYWRRRAEHFENALQHLRAHFEDQLNEQRTLLDEKMMALVACQENCNAWTQEKHYDIVREQVCDKDGEEMNDDSSNNSAMNSVKFQKVASESKPMEEVPVEPILSPSATNEIEGKEEGTPELKDPDSMKTNENTEVQNQENQETQDPLSPSESTLNDGLIPVDTQVMSHLTPERALEMNGSHSIPSSASKPDFSPPSSDSNSISMDSNIELNKTFTRIADNPISSDSNQTHVVVPLASSNTSASPQNEIKTLTREQLKDAKLPKNLKPELPLFNKTKSTDPIKISVSIPSTLSSLPSSTDSSFFQNSSNSNCDLDPSTQICICDPSLSCALSSHWNIICCFHETIASSSADDFTELVKHDCIPSPIANLAPLSETSVLSSNSSLPTAVKDAESGSVATSFSFNSSIYFSIPISILSIFLSLVCLE